MLLVNLIFIYLCYAVHHTVVYSVSHRIFHLFHASIFTIGIFIHVLQIMVDVFSSNIDQYWY